MRVLWSLCVFSFVLSGQVWAADLHVPAEYPTIADAVAAAANADTIILADGVYTGAGNSEITISGKDVAIRSASGAGACIIDLEDATNRAFVITSSGLIKGGGGSFLDGLTIRNSNALQGGALYATQASKSITQVTVTNCVFEHHANAAVDVVEGGAVYVNGAQVTFHNCVFADNGIPGNNFDITASGAAVSTQGSCNFARCTFRNNGSGFFGQGAAVVSYSSSTFRECIFENNDAGDGGAVYFPGSAGGCLSKLHFPAEQRLHELQWWCSHHVDESQCRDS